MIEIIDRIKKQRMFEDCSALLLYLHKEFWNPKVVINAIADIEKEPVGPALVKHSMTAFALGFFLGYLTHEPVKEVLEKASEGKGTEEEFQFTVHFMQLVTKLQNTGILSRGQVPWMS